MIWFIVYAVGCMLAGWLTYVNHKRYMKEHPEETCENYQWGFAVVLFALSWIAVIFLLAGNIASFNQLDWEEDKISQKELDEYMANPENREATITSEELGVIMEEHKDLTKLREKALRLMREKELKAAQQEALKNKRNF